MEHQHTLEPVRYPLLLVSGRPVENDFRLASESGPKLLRFGMGIKKAREIGLDSIQGFLELGTGIHGQNLSRLVLTA